MKLNTSITLALLSAILMGCSQVSLDTNRFQIQSFDDFLWKKHIPDTIKTVINTEFAECDGIAEPLKLQICDDFDKPIPTSIAQIYVNGDISQDNTISIDKNQDSTYVWIVLGNSVTHKDTEFRWNLSVVNNPGLLRINEAPPSVGLSIPDVTISGSNDHISNPLAVIVIWIGIALLSLLLLWFILLRPIIFRKFRFDELKIVYMEEGARVGAPQDITLSHARKLILGQNPQKQGGFNRFWTGRIIYLEHDFWEHEVEISPCGDDGLSFNETSKEDTIYRTRSSMIESTNGPRRPFVVSKRKSNITANISIS